MQEYHGESMDERVRLKKYGNRRLYNMESSAYVTLDDVAGIIQNGQTVVVHDAKTGEDVTTFILTQIILEEARKKNVLLSVPLLHLMIRHGDHLLSDFFDKHLEEMLKHFLACQSLADEQFSTWLKMGTNFSKGMQSMPNFALFQGFPNIFETFKTEEKDHLQEAGKRKTPMKTGVKKKEK
jgi:polyhydroxyalkanoate synthesis repressor PhaR